MAAKLNEGLMIGKFAPLTNGHLTAFGLALSKCHKLNVVVCIDHLNDPQDCPLNPDERIRSVVDGCKALSSRIEVHVIDCTTFPYAKEDDEKVSLYWAEALHEKFPNTGTLFGSELYIEMMARQWPVCTGVNHEILDIQRDMTHISATMIRQKPFLYWEHIPSHVRPYFTRNVLVLGAESCGKSTLTRELGKILRAPVVPEMYRSIYVGKGMDFEPKDLIAVATAQSKAQREASRTVFNKGLVLHDTCCEITSMYLEEYFPKHEDFGDVYGKVQGFVATEPKFDVIFFCDTDTPWENDGTRTLGDKRDRKRMRDLAYSIAVQKAKRHGCELVVLPADYKRLPAALEKLRGIM